MSTSCDISFDTTDGTALSYTGALAFPRSDIPQALTYIIAGLVRNGAGSGAWAANQVVVP